MKDGVGGSDGQTSSAVMLCLSSGGWGVMGGGRRAGASSTSAGPFVYCHCHCHCHCPLFLYCCYGKGMYGDPVANAGAGREINRSFVQPQSPRLFNQFRARPRLCAQTLGMDVRIWVNNGRIGGSGLRMF